MGYLTKEDYVLWCKNPGLGLQKQPENVEI